MGETAGRGGGGALQVCLEEQCTVLILSMNVVFKEEWWSLANGFVHMQIPRKGFWKSGLQKEKKKEKKRSETSRAFVLVFSPFILIYFIFYFSSPTGSPLSQSKCAWP